MNPDLKQKLHQLVDQCNDEYLLEEAKAVLESDESGKEFWEELDDGVDYRPYIYGQKYDDFRLFNQAARFRKK